MAIVPVRLGGEDYRRAHDACHAVAGLWNWAVGWVRDEWDAGRRPGKWDISAALTGLDAVQRPVHVHTAQAVAHDLYEAISTSRTNRGHGLKARAPWRTKQYRPLSFTAGYGWRPVYPTKPRPKTDVPRDPVSESMIGTPTKLALSFGRGRPRILLPVPEIIDSSSGLVVPVERWGEIQLCWDRENRCWNLHIAYTTNRTVLSGDRVMAIDEGIINSFTTATLIDGVLEVVVVNGREGRAIKQRRNKQNAKLAARQARCTNGSRKHKRLAQSRKKVNGRCRRRQRDFNHHVTAKTADLARAQQVGRIVVGDVRGIEQNTAKRRRASRSTRQQLSQWERGTQERYLTEKTGITLEHLNEAFTTVTCPACLTRNRPQGRNYRCKHPVCGFVCHRDAVGAINIWRRALTADSVCLDPNHTIRVTYLRAVPRWTSAQSGTHRKAQHRKARARSTAPEQGRPHHQPGSGSCWTAT